MQIEEREVPDKEALGDDFDQHPRQFGRHATVSVKYCQQCKSVILASKQNQGIAVCDLCSLVQSVSLAEWADIFGTPIQPTSSESKEKCSETS